MKKRFYLPIFILILTLCAACLCACTSGREPAAKVSLVLNGGTGVGVNDFVSGNMLVEPERVPTREGYTFAGYFTDEELSVRPEFDTILKDNVTVYVAWEQKKVMGVFVLGGEGEILVEASGGRFTPPEATRPGYELLGWYSDRELLTQAEFTAADGKVFYAKWRIINYSITYETDGLARCGIDAKFSYTVNDSVSLAYPSSIASGYTFLGWADESGEYVADIEKGSVGNRAFRAVFISSNNFVERIIGGSFDGNSAQIDVTADENAIDFTEKIVVSDRADFAVTRNGGGRIVGDWAVPDGTTELELKVTAENGDVREYALTVVKHADIDVKITVTDKFGKAEELTRKEGGTLGYVAEERVGYAFAGFWRDEEYSLPFDEDSAITESVELYAKYDAIVYTIVYDIGDGQNSPENPATYTIETGAKLKEAVPPEGYAFICWFDEEGNVVEEILPGQVGNLKLRAAYEELE